MNILQYILIYCQDQYCDDRLSAPEKHAMARFKIADDTHEENANDEVGEETLSYADRAIMRADRNKRQRLG